MSDWKASEPMLDAAMKTATAVADGGEYLAIDRDVMAMVLNASLEAAVQPRPLKIMQSPPDPELAAGLRATSRMMAKEAMFAQWRAVAIYLACVVVLALLFALTVLDSGTVVAMRDAAETGEDWEGASYWFSVLLWTRVSAIALLAGAVAVAAQAVRAFKNGRGWRRRIARHDLEEATRG